MKQSLRFAGSIGLFLISLCLLTIVACRQTRKGEAPVRTFFFDKPSQKPCKPEVNWVRVW